MNNTPGHYTRFGNRFVLQPESISFEDALKKAREMMAECAKKAAAALGDSVPQVIETNLPDGSIRMQLKWADGELTNDVVLTPKTSGN